MDNIRTGLGMGHLESLKNKASHLLKDSLKIARLALVDVSIAELMTEEVTNADEWGPTTKQMAEIAHSSNNSEDYLRIVHVLRKRFALNTHKFWRQIHKSLILLEYLLCHGPEHLVMEFRQDKSRIEELSRFVYVDSNGTDRGSPIQRRAKHVLHVLVDEAFYKRERTQAQKISSGISGFGSASMPTPHHQAALNPRSKFAAPRSLSAFSLSESTGFRGADSESLLLDDADDDQFHSEPASREPSRSLFKEPQARDFSSPSTTETSSWRTFSNSSGGAESLCASGRSTMSTCSGSDVKSNEDSPTHTSSFPKTSQTLDMDSVASDLENSSNNITAPSLQTMKLPPPPPIAGYKGSRVRRTQLPERGQSGHFGSAPDLIGI